MLDGLELAGRIRDAMDKRQPKLTSAALAEACGVTPQAVYEWRKTGRVSKGYLNKIAAETGKPLEYFLGDDVDGVPTNFGLTLKPDEAEAMKKLQEALPDWRRYVLGLAMVEKSQQELLLKAMRQTVPDYRVEDEGPRWPRGRVPPPIAHVKVGPGSERQTGKKKDVDR